MKEQLNRTNLKPQNASLDFSLILTSLVLVFIGLVAIYDSSVVAAFRDFGDKAYFFKNQLTWTVLGCASLLFFSYFDYHKLIKLSHYILGASTVALIAVLLPFVGEEILGARRWISIGSFTFQPSEFAKLSVVFYATMIMTKFESYKIRLVDSLLVYFLPIGIITGLVILEPDLGTALVFMATAVLIYFIGKAPAWHFLVSIPVFVMAAVAAILKEPYRLNRIKAFLDPSFDPQGASYQINQIIIALSAGGLLGVGLGASRSKFDFIPEVHNDAIFAVIVEETGFIGAIILISIFVFLITKCIKIAREAPDTAGQILASGITALLAAQTFLNLASIVALVPLTGIPLPFISYGGSSLFTTLTAIGMLVNIKRKS